MNALILGSAGQLGTAFRRLLPEAVPCSRRQVDLAKPETIEPAMQQFKPDVVLNCAAYNAVDQAERDVAGAFAVNAFGVRALALACRAAGVSLVHFSTNYVFGQDAARQTPYTETDLPGPQSAYAVSKLAGEHFVRSICPRHLVIRTCGLFGRIEHAAPSWNFIEKLLDRARRGEKLRVVNDQIGTPTSVFDLAEATLNLLRAGAVGLYHFTNAGACSWHEFAEAALRYAGLDLPIEAVSSAAFSAAAPRPGYSVLDCTAYERNGLVQRRTWQDSLEQYCRQRSASPE